MDNYRWHQPLKAAIEALRLSQQVSRDISRKKIINFYCICPKFLRLIICIECSKKNSSFLLQIPDMAFVQNIFFSALKSVFAIRIIFNSAKISEIGCMKIFWAYGICLEVFVLLCCISRYLFFHNSLFGLSLLCIPTLEPWLRKWRGRKWPAHGLPIFHFTTMLTSFIIFRTIRIKVMYVFTKCRFSWQKILGPKKK